MDKIIELFFDKGGPATVVITFLLGIVVFFAKKSISKFESSIESAEKKCSDMKAKIQEYEIERAILMEKLAHIQDEKERVIKHLELLEDDLRQIVNEKDIVTVKVNNHEQALAALSKLIKKLLSDANKGKQ